MKNTIIDLAQPYDDVMSAIAAPDPTDLLDRVQGRMNDPDIRDLVGLVEKQVEALKAAKAALIYFIAEHAAGALAEYLDQNDTTESEKHGYD